MTVTREAIAVPESTRPTIALLRDMRRGRAKKRASDAAFWIYLVALVVALYGSEQIAAAFRALRHPPPAGARAPEVLHAAPYGLAALALVVLVVLLRDALWRGPVTLPQPTVDWLLGTPVSRGRLLRPRFRLSAALAIVAGAAVGVVPAAAMVGFGLGGHGTGSVLRLTAAAMASTALLFALGTGLACLVERHQAGARWLRRLSPAAFGAAAVFAGLAAWSALGRPPAALAATVLWSGPWGWAAQGAVAMAGRAATRRRARFRLRPPRRRAFVLLWRDLLAVARTPARLAGATALALLAVGMLAASGHQGQTSLLPVACALALGYLAAAWLCEGARLDAEDTGRSEQLPFRFGSLAWRHAAVPCLVLLAAAGVPTVVASAVAGAPRFVILLAVTVPVLVAGALVNVFRGEFAPDLFAGVDTPFGNTAVIKIVFWYAWGPVLAIVPMSALLPSALAGSRPGPLERAVVIGAGLAAALAAYAARRAARLRSA